MEERGRLLTVEQGLFKPKRKVPRRMRTGAEGESQGGGAP